MATIVIDGLEADVEDRLHRRAKRHGRSVEAEARDILRAAADKEEVGEIGLGTRIANRFAGIGLRPGEELERLPFEEPRDPFEK